MFCDLFKNHFDERLHVLSGHVGWKKPFVCLLVKWRQRSGLSSKATQISASLICTRGKKRCERKQFFSIWLQATAEIVCSWRRVTFLTLQFFVEIKRVAVFVLCAVDALLKFVYCAAAWISHGITLHLILESAAEEPAAWICL